MKNVICSETDHDSKTVFERENPDSKTVFERENPELLNQSE